MTVYYNNSGHINVSHEQKCGEWRLGEIHVCRFLLFRWASCVCLLLSLILSALLFLHSPKLEPQKAKNTN